MERSNKLAGYYPRSPRKNTNTKVSCRLRTWRCKSAVQAERKNCNWPEAGDFASTKFRKHQITLLQVLLLVREIANESPPNSKHIQRSKHMAGNNRQAIRMPPRYRLKVWKTTACFWTRVLIASSQQIRETPNPKHVPPQTPTSSPQTNGHQEADTAKSKRHQNTPRENMREPKDKQRLQNQPRPNMPCTFQIARQSGREPHPLASWEMAILSRSEPKDKTSVRAARHA